MDIFENRKIKGIHKSRYVASWNHAKVMFGSFIREKKGPGPKYFEAWIRTLEIDGEHLTEDEIDELTEFYNCGKLELEKDVAKYWKSTTNEEGLY